MTKQLNEHLRQVKKNLCCEKEAQAVFEQRVQTAVRDIQAEHPDVSWEQCVEILGTPEQMAEEYMQEFSPEYISGYRKKQQRKWGYGIAAAVLAIVVLAVVAGYWWFVKSTHVVDVQTTISDAGNVGDVQSIPNLLQEDQEESE